MNAKILVTYASRSGSTAGVAEAIGKTLAAETGALVDVRPVSEVTDLSPYQAVVAGSAIQGQKWLPEALAFLKKHRAELAQRPFAAFQVCITLSMKGGEQYRAGVAAWMDPVRSLVQPISAGLFAGSLDFSKMPLTFNTLMMRIPVLMKMWQVGDHRDWDAIHTWSLSLAKQLQSRGI
jgi:menaquinone-dependent protoporphyrinogen oxidase